jgi:hypothetical protein
MSRKALLTYDVFKIKNKFQFEDVTIFFFFNFKGKLNFFYLKKIKGKLNYKKKII